RSQYALHTSDFERVRALFTRHAGESDAVATQGDQLAQAVIRIAVEQGLRVPDDVAVMGVGGLVSSADGALPLSTVGFDAEKVGRAALDLLSEQLNGKRAVGRPKRAVLQPYLQPRAS